MNENNLNPAWGDMIIALVIMLILAIVFRKAIGQFITQVFFAVVRTNVKFNLGAFLGWLILAAGVLWMYMKYIHPIFTAAWW